MDSVHQSASKIAAHLSQASLYAEAEALFTSIGEGAIMTDRDGNVKRINKVALDLLGVTAEQILGKWYPGVIQLEDETGKSIPKFERPITEVFIAGKPVFRKAYLRRPDGKRIAVALTVSPVLVDKKPIGAIQIFRDISEEVRLDKAKSDFIAVASHQLRTPATGVKQYLGMLLEGYVGELTEQQLAFVRTAYQGNERQLHIVDDILKVAAADSGNLVLNKQPVELIGLIADVIDEQAAKLDDRNQTVIFKRSEPELHAVVDDNIFRMVLENIIDNAHKYTPPDKTIEIKVTKSSDGATISVADEGVGIQKQDMDKLFQKFSRLDNSLSVSAGGTGLGLYWVKQVLALHDATITVEPNKAKSSGSVFNITLPNAQLLEQ